MRSVWDQRPKIKAAGPRSLAMAPASAQDGFVSSAVFVLPEELSERTWEYLAETATIALDSTGQRLVVECSALVRFDDYGIAMLVGLAHYSQRRQVRVLLANPPLPLRERLEVTGMAWFFDWRPLSPRDDR